MHFTVLITLVCHQDLTVIDYGKLGRRLIFLLIDFLAFLCQVRTSALKKVCFCQKEDFSSSNTSPKRNRFGIKLFLLCDCESRYILRFFIYTGYENAAPDVVKKLGNSGVVVHSLLSPSYLHKGHILFVDN